jgi:hypothetical protein
LTRFNEKFERRVEIEKKKLKNEYLKLIFFKV